MNSNMAQIRAEQTRILALPGRLAFVKVVRLARTSKIFVGNARALLEHLKRMEDPAVLLPTWSDRQAFETFLDETERHLHNYVAAAHSRVDHLRRFAADELPEDSPVGAEYRWRVEEQFAASPLHKFIIDFRNFMLHARLPVSTARESWERGGASTFQVMLPSADLLRWGRWSSLAREYIEAGGESVDLGKTVSTYTDKVIAFDRWVAESFIREHLEAIEAYQREVQKHQAWLRELGLYDDR